MSLLGALAWIVAVSMALVAIHRVQFARAAQRVHDDARTLHWQSGPPTPAHRVHDGVVQDAVRLGYVVADQGTVRVGGRDFAITLLAHADGSTIDATTLPRLVVGDVAVASVTSLLADRRSVLETHSRQGTLAGPHRLLEVLTDADLPTLVAQHRATREWLSWRGLPPVLHERGAVGLFELSAHLTGAQSPPSPGEVWRLGAGRSTPNQGPLAAQTGTEGRLARLQSSAGPPTSPPAR